LIVFPFAALVAVPIRERVCRSIDRSFLLAQITLLGSAGGLWFTPHLIPLSHIRKPHATPYCISERNRCDRRDEMPHFET
jgi:hypothetical protein